jgi:hypothetical protein
MGALWRGRPARATAFPDTNEERAMRRPGAAVTVLVMALGMAVGSAHGQAKGHAAPEQFVLSGVLVFEGGRGLAWIQEPALTGNRVVALRPGESIGPYRLKKVLDDRVELEGPAGTVLVPLSGASAPAPAAVAATAAPRPSTPSPTSPSVDTAAPRGTPETTAAPPVTPEAALRQIEERTPMGDLFKNIRKAATAAQSTSPSQSASPPPSNPKVMSLPQGDPSKQAGWRGLFGGR